MSDQQTSGVGNHLVGSVAVGLYGWAITLSFGAVLLDVVYSRTVRTVLGGADTGAVFSEVSDFLLWPLGLTVLAAVGALAGSWERPAARNVLVASVAAMIVPVFLVALVGEQLAALEIGHWVRLGASGSASILALVAFGQFHRSQPVLVSR